MNLNSSNLKKYYSPLIGAALATASLFHFSLPVFAAGTTAGTDLINKATATYKDGDENRYEVTSNEVTVTVGKIAGITNIASGNNSTGPILAGQSLGMDFRITNTGNDVSSIFIPSVATIQGYSGTTSNLTVDSVTYRLSSDPDVPASYIDRSTLTNGVVENIAEDDFIIVRVNITIDSGVADNENIAVQLGNTGPNDDSVDTQNQPDEISGSPDTASDDVRTVNPDPAGTPDPAVDTDPVNGQREASAINTTQVNAVPIALPRITKTDSGVDQNGTPLEVDDDIITYNLELEVLDSGLASYTSPNFNFSFEDLEGRDYSTATSTDSGVTAGTNVFNLANRSNLILISDAIPENTTLTLDGTGEPIGVEAPAGWTRVYTHSPLTVPADEAVWRTTVAALPTTTNPNTITRVGWVYNATPTTAAPPGSGAILQGGAPITGFNFDVQTTGITGTTNIYNLAQVFGSTDDGVPGTTDGDIVFDESGDQNPSNFNDDGNGRTAESVPTSITRGGATTAEYGIAEPTDTVGIDPGGSTGAGAGGEAHEVEVILSVTTTSDILNGPGGAPDAVGGLFGIVDDNHDFQNRSARTPLNSTIVPADFDANGNVIKTYDPDEITFTNEVFNDSDDPVDVVLRPISPVYNGLRDPSAIDNLPDGTRVLIQYSIGGVNTAVEFEYNAGAFTQSAAGNSVIDNSIPIIGTPLTITNLAVDASETYTVTVDLPDLTELSTSYVDVNNPSAGVVGGYPVPIVAFIDRADPIVVGNADGFDVADIATFDADEDVYNITINQVYTGFLQLEKTATIFGRDNLEDPNSTYSEVTRDPIPGDIIEYDITYTNISEAQGSSESGNGLLTVDDLIITEDGTANGNTWAANVDGDGIIDTLHVEGEATEIDPLTDAPPAAPAVIRYTDDTTASSNDDTSLAGEIVRYEFGGTNGIDGIEPGDSGIFRFRRKVTEESDS